MKLSNVKISDESVCHRCNGEFLDGMKIVFDSMWRNPLVLRHENCKLPYGEPKPEVVAVTQKEVVVEETKVEDIGEVDTPNSGEVEVTVEDGKDKDEKGIKTRKKH